MWYAHVRALCLCVCASEPCVDASELINSKYGLVVTRSTLCFQNNQFSVTVLATGQLRIGNQENGFFTDFENDLLPVSKNGFFLSNPKTK